MGNGNMHCPCCGAGKLEVFYRIDEVPVHNVLLMRSREQALSCPRGDIRLGYCTQCAFIYNTAFDTSRLRYQEGYEESQSSSALFRKFHAELAKELVSRHKLRGKHVLEIGCGKGEFLELLILAGCAQALGYDPAYASGRIRANVRDRITIMPQYFTGSKALPEIDMLVCKMTLEHIPQPLDFMRMIRRSLEADTDTPLFFMVPDMTRILAEGAFWDIYYEHCCYFLPAALRSLFEHSGFSIEEIRSLYGDQYLSLHAICGMDTPRAESGLESGNVVEEASHFARLAAEQREQWQDFMHEQNARGRPVALWGGGSKAVSFVTAMKPDEELACVVDIQPVKQGCYLPGSGHQVVAPEQLCEQAVETVIVMNPLYLDEIAASCTKLGISPQLLTLEQGPSGMA